MNFVVARNPDPDSRLPYLIQLPIDGGLILKVRDTWPRTSRVFCARVEGGWPPDAEIVEEVSVTLCRRRSRNFSRFRRMKVVLGSPHDSNPDRMYAAVPGTKGQWNSIVRSTSIRCPRGHCPRRLRRVDGALVESFFSSLRGPNARAGTTVCAQRAVLRPAGIA